MAEARLDTRGIVRTAGGTAVSLMVSCAIVALLVHLLDIDWRSLPQEWQRANKTPLVAAVLLAVVTHVALGAHRLWLILRCMGTQVRLREVIALRLGEGPLRAMLPMKGGEFVAIAWFWRRMGLSLSASAGALVFDRSLNVVGVSFWLLAGVLLTSASDTGLHVFGVLGLVAVYVVALFVTPAHDLAIGLAGRIHARLGRIASGLLRPWREFTAARKLFFLAYGVVYASRPILIAALLFDAYDIHPQVGHLLTYTSLAIFAGMVPGPLLGIGPREGTMVALYAAYAVDGNGVLLSVGLLLSLSVHVIPFLMGAPWTPWLLYQVLRSDDPDTKNVSG